MTPRDPITHDVKCWPEFFEATRKGLKTFDIRRNDRDYRVGDRLHMQEWDPSDGQYTGRSLKKHIVYMIEGVGTGAIPPLAGLHHKYAVLGLR